MLVLLLLLGRVVDLWSGTSEARGDGGEIGIHCGNVITWWLVGFESVEQGNLELAAQRVGNFGLIKSVMSVLGSATATSSNAPRIP